MPKIYIEHNQHAMQEVFIDIGWGIARNMDEADCLVLIGGADIHPSWYGAPSHPRTGGSLSRDEHTDNLFLEAIEKKIPILGICRGAQFVNARVGGGMYQDVNHHAGGRHRVYDLFDKSYHSVNSIHHQMMIPTEAAVCVAKAVQGEADTNIATYREIAVIEGEGDSEKVHLVDIPVSEDAPEWEVLYYPEQQALLFQAHPEYDFYNGTCRQYFYKLLKRYYPQWEHE